MKNRENIENIIFCAFTAFFGIALLLVGVLANYGIKIQFNF